MVCVVFLIIESVSGLFIRPMCEYVFLLITLKLILMIIMVDDEYDDNSNSFAGLV